MTVFSATRWSTNADLIADAASLGYLGGRVLDATHGYGIFWQQWQPKELVRCDKNPTKAPDVVADFRRLPFPDDSFDSVVYDPPYKLNGTPTDEVDERYGVDMPARWQDRLQLMCDGLVECIRVSRRFILAKCMDQVVSGKKVWQTDTLTQVAWNYYAKKVDRFDMLVTPRPQPPGRRQVHSQGNYSTLLVFEKVNLGHGH